MGWYCWEGDETNHFTHQHFLASSDIVSLIYSSAMILNIVKKSWQDCSSMLSLLLMKLESYHFLSGLMVASMFSLRKWELFQLPDVGNPINWILSVPSMEYGSEVLCTWLGGVEEYTGFILPHSRLDSRSPKWFLCM